jgi:hypothetical protein
MGYVIKNTQGFIISRLTDVGRRKISQGNFNISYFQIGDSEVNYTAVTNFDAANSMVIEPSYNAQNNTGVPASNKNAVKYPYYLQGSSGVTYGIPFQASSIDSVYNTAAPSGFFSASTGCTIYTPADMVPIPTNGYTYNSSRVFTLSTLNSVTKTTLATTTTTCTDNSNGTISANTYVTSFMQNATDSFLCACMNSCRPILTYKVQNYTGTTLTVDRYLPKLDGFSPTANGRLFFYPSSFSYYDFPTPINYWASSVINFESICTPEDGIVKIWNMNIPWSESPAGTQSTNYTFEAFPSVNYLGTKEYYGYSTSSGQTDTSSTYYYNSFGDKINVAPEDQKAIAIVHYTNNTIINFYGEKFATEAYDSTDPGGTGQARNFVVNIPSLMWHKNSNCCGGAKFYIDPPNFDGLDLLTPYYIQSTKNTDMNNPGIRYYHLYDTNANANDGGRPNRVGKVFPDDKIIVFDDEEIIAAMSMVSNRNFTLPAPRLTSTKTLTVDGLLADDTECVWVTYLFDSDGVWDGMHCNYYTKEIGPVSGCTTDEQDVIVSFGGDLNCMVAGTSGSFPTGWVAKKFYVIAQKTAVGTRPTPNNWKIINFNSQLTLNASGFIVPSNFLSNTFKITKALYDAASTYNINTYLQIPTLNSTGRIQFGEEYFFYGTINTDIEATIYEMRYLINLPGNQFVKSSNPTWTEGQTTYMTEIGLYDDDKDLIVYSKFQYPQIRQGTQQTVVKLDF